MVVGACIAVAHVKISPTTPLNWRERADTITKGGNGKQKAMTDRLSPKRIQRKRTKGWKMPKGAIYGNYILDSLAGFGVRSSHD